MSIVIDGGDTIAVPVGTPVTVPAVTKRGYFTFKRNGAETPEAMHIRVQEKVDMLKLRAQPLAVHHAVSARAGVCRGFCHQRNAHRSLVRFVMRRWKQQRWPGTEGVG
jgi:hypothetical protein